MSLRLSQRQGGDMSRHAVYTLDMRKKPAPPPEAIISVARAAELLGCTTRTIQRKIKGGELAKAIGTDGREGVLLKSIKAADSPPQMPPTGDRRHDTMSHATRHDVAATVAATRGRHVAPHNPATAALIARLEASLEAERQRNTDLEQARAREVARQNDHIDSLRTELTAAHASAEAARQENLNLHRQLADARQHETERARLAPPSSPGDVIEGTPAEQPGATESGTKKPSRRRSAAPPAKPEPRAGWWSRLFG